MPTIKQFACPPKCVAFGGKIITLPLILLISLLFALPPLDPDLGWFLRCGKESCGANNFSVLLPGYQWYRPMIIYPKIISFVFNHFSFWGLTILNILIGLAGFFFFHKIISSETSLLLKTQLAVSAIVFVISTLLSFSTLSTGLRNQSLSLLFFLAVIYFLTAKKYIFLIPLFILWANFHPSFPIGLILIFLYLISSPKFIIHNSIFLILSVLATLINPFGLKIYQDIFSHFTTPLNTLVAEWVPPAPFHQLLIISFLFLFFILSLLKKRLLLFYTLSLIFFAFLALSARRNLPFFYYLLPIVISRFFSLSHLRYLSYLPLFIPAAFSILPKTIDVNTNWNSYCHKGITNFPCEATEFLKTQPASWRGNIFNTYEWGGFLIWQLPHFKVFIDGRMPAWLDRRSLGEGGPYPLYLSTYQTQPGWRETLEKYKIDYILISPGTFLDLELKTNKYPWKEIFKSEFSVIYKKLP